MLSGRGEGSCLAPPYRSPSVQWTDGCPDFAPCCSEYGYCQPRQDWQRGEFRDCNMESNGTPLPLNTLQREFLEILEGRPGADDDLLGL